MLLTVYGYDLYSEEIDGMIGGEMMVLKSYNLSENQYTALTPTWNPAFASSDGKFVTEGLSAISALKLEGASGVGGEALAAANVSVYPNPAKDVLTINLSGFEDLTGLKGTILTADGRPVKTFALASEKTTVDISSLQPGVYMLIIESYKGLVLKMMVIQ